MFCIPKTSFVCGKIIFVYGKQCFVYEKLCFVYGKLCFVYGKDCFVYRKYYFVYEKYILKYVISFWNKIIYYGFSNIVNNIKIYIIQWIFQSNIFSKIYYYYFKLFKNIVYIKIN